MASRSCLSDASDRSDVELRFERSFDQLAKGLAGRFGFAIEDAEDAVQIAFMRLIEHQPEGNIGGWLFTVAKHELFARYHRLRREPLGATVTDGVAPGADEQLDAVGTLDLIRFLKPHQQLCLVMQAIGFSYQEISEQTGQTRTWVNRHLTEGRRALRNLAD